MKNDDLRSKLRGIKPKANKSGLRDKVQFLTGGNAYTLNYLYNWKY
jgi:hypothetical protein